MKKTITEVHEVSPKQLTDALCDSVNETLNKRLDQLEANLQPKVPDEYMTRKEVASLFKVSLVTTYEWDKKGILKPYKIGKNRVRYLRAEIETIHQEKGV